LGVGIGGTCDYPDDAYSGTYKKPWSNDAVKQIIDFSNAKNDWLGTWNGDDVALAVHSVKIWAL